MIIDVHTHMFGEEVPSASYWDVVTKTVSRSLDRPEEKVRTWWAKWWDLTGDTLVQDMDEAGIDKAVHFVEDIELCKWVGRGKYTIEEQNAFVAKAAERHPDRIIPFASVDPRRPNAVALLEKCVKEWGMRGVKLQTAAGWYPDEKEYYPLWEKAQELGIIALFHTGPETFPMRTKYCHPDRIDEVAADFPELKIIMAHCGFCWWEEAAWIASFKGNVYLDLSAWQWFLRRNLIEELYRPIRKMMSMIGGPKILWASDWPATRAVRGQGYVDWIKVFRDAPGSESLKEAGIEFTEDEINGILGGNAARLLGL